MNAVLTIIKIMISLSSKMMSVDSRNLVSCNRITSVENKEIMNVKKHWIYFPITAVQLHYLHFKFSYYIENHTLLRSSILERSKIINYPTSTFIRSGRKFNRICRILFWTALNTIDIFIRAAMREKNWSFTNVHLRTI